MADNDILQGFQLGFQSSLQRQRLKSEAALQRLQEQQIAQAMALKMEQNNLAIQARADGLKAMSAFNEATSDTINVPMPGFSKDEIGEMAPPLMSVENPNKMGRFEAFSRFIAPVIAQYEGPEKASTALHNAAVAEARIQEAEKRNFTPTGMTVQVPGGRQISGYMAGPNQFVPDMPVEVQQVGPAGGGATVITTPRGGIVRVPESASDRQRVQLEGQERAAQLKFIRDNAPQAYADLISASQINAETGMPEVTNEALQSAAKAAGFQGGTLGQMEQQNISAESLVQVGKELFPLLTKENVGVRGFAQRWGARLGLDGMPGFKNASDAEKAATLGRVFVASIFRTLRSDSNINEREVRALEAAAPDPAKIITQPEVIKAQMSALLKNAAEKSRSNAVRMGREVSPFFTTQQELEERISSGQITPAQAAELYNRSAWALIDALETK